MRSFALAAGGQRAAATIIIRGLAQVAPLAAPISDATLCIAVWDVARMDVPATRVACWTQDGLWARAGDTLTLPFSLHVRPPRSREWLVVRGHLGVAVAGRVSVGDYVSVQSYPLALFTAQTPGRLELMYISGD